VDVYKDRFFTEEAPVWFRGFLWMEAGGHVPVGFWGVWVLWGGRGGEFFLILGGGGGGGGLGGGDGVEVCCLGW